MTASLTTIDDYLLAYISEVYIAFLNELYIHNITILSQEQKYTYKKTGFKFVSIDQDPYQCKELISIAYPPLNVNKHKQYLEIWV